MKFMSQETFEVFALMLAEYKVAGDSKFYIDIKKQMYSDHQDKYSGDILWLEQAESIVPGLIKIVSDYGAKDKQRSLHVARDLRAKLDVDLNPITGLKKIFNGSAFEKSHPAPNMRATLAIRNILLLFAKMEMLGFQHK
jgi:hypothetical protein